MIDPESLLRKNGDVAPGISKDTIKKITGAILKGIEKDIDIWANEIEQKYPEWKGSRILQRSGNQHQRKLIFGYDNEKADELEVGIPAKKVTGRYTQRVKSHERKLGISSKAKLVTKLMGKLKKKKRVNVKAHKREYRNYKPIQLESGDWIMVSKTPKQKATKPVSKSARKRLTGKAGEKLIADAIKQAFI